MFKIIGADQKEYGPVSTAQIRQWVTDGRLNAATTAQRATGGDWQPLSAFEEFADMFQPAGAAPAAQAATGTPYTPGAAPIPTASREMALSAVKGPAIALMVCGALGIAFYLYNTATVVAHLGQSQPIPENTPPIMRSFLEGTHSPFALVVSLFLLAMNGFIVFSTSRMMKLHGHTLAIITCILAMIPCFSGICCLLGLPFGIWGVIMLNKPEVKSQFTN